jgi:large subunit ribosomal protein L35
LAIWDDRQPVYNRFKALARELVARSGAHRGRWMSCFADSISRMPNPAEINARGSPWAHRFIMQKTKKSVAKRFKLTATGKLMRRTPGFRHLLAAKSTKSKRRASKDKLVAPGHAKPLKRCLPFGL